MSSGEGTFGRVYLVENTRKKGAYYALKVMKKEKIIGLHQVSHVNDERFILSTVNSPFIVKLYVMELDMAISPIAH